MTPEAWWYFAGLLTIPAVALLLMFVSVLTGRAQFTIRASVTRAPPS